MKTRWLRRLRISSPWIAGLVILFVASWMWDSHNYPLPRWFTNYADPFGPETIAEKWTWKLRAAKDRRFWNSLDLESNPWQATHATSGTVSLIRFSKGIIQVDPPKTMIGVPFVNDTAYEVIDSLNFKATIPAPRKNGTPIRVYKRVSFEGSGKDGSLHLVTTSEDTFTLEKARTSDWKR